MARLAPSLLVTAVVAALFGFAGAAAFSYSGLGGNATRAYLLANPDILPDVADKLRQREAETRLAAVSGEVDKPFPGAVLGNPNGKVTLVEFSDYGCTYCRHSVEDVKALVAANPELRVVMREWPIFEGSDAAARMALAAAKQGKYAAFHDAMFAHGPPSEQTIAIAARAAGLEMAQAQAYAASPEVQFELAKNMEYARKLGFEGTPSWVAGKRVFSGAVGQAGLKQALESARES
ncbi:MAG: DsbA family protein [Tsuneonella sp.]